VSGGGYVEKKKNTPLKGISPLAGQSNSQSAPQLGGLWEESKVERKVIKTIKISVVWTVSGRGYVEKK
jgi:hypothetical protein